jgi:cation:H+ antiporter
LVLLGAGTLILFAAMFTGGRRKLDRWEAAILLGIYLLYTGWLIANEL